MEEDEAVEGAAEGFLDLTFEASSAGDLGDDGEIGDGVGGDGDGEVLIFGEVGLGEGVEGGAVKGGVKSLCFGGDAFGVLPEGMDEVDEGVGGFLFGVFGVVSDGEGVGGHEGRVELKSGC